MKNKLLRSWQPAVAFALLLISFTGCVTIKPEKIVYDEETQLYAYPVAGDQAVLLRNEKGALVNRSNYNEFLAELAQMNFHYPFQERAETAEVLKEEDRKMAELYAESAENIQNEKYRAAADKLDTLRRIYPESVWYSDVPFLQGFAYEQAGDTVLSAIRYSEFLNYSSKKYSDRFRGYKYADPKGILWREQREYADAALQDKQPEAETIFFESIQPKYYFQSLQPGYALNEEDLATHRSGNLFVTLGIDFSDEFELGLQYYLSLGKVLDINPGYFTSGNISTFSLALPLQLYRAPDNSLGIKLSPFARYSNFREITFDGYDWEMDEQVFNAGFKISAGYYFVQRFSAGGYYTWYYYNKNRPYVAKSQPLNLWWYNEYDVSFYYNILKGFSLKAGVKSDDIVAGIYWNGMEVSYNITSPGFILRSDLY